MNRKPQWTPEQLDHIDNYARRWASVWRSDPWAYARAKREMLMGWVFPSDFRRDLERLETQRRHEIAARVRSAFAGLAS